MSQTRYVTDAEVREYVPLDQAIALVEKGFKADALGEVRNFPVVREWIPEHDGIFGVKSGYLPVAGVLGLKSGGYWARNPERHGLGAHQSTVLLFQPETGQLLGVVAANYLTGLRTGAAGAVAARALARPDSRRVGMIGTGVQAEMQLRCLAQVLHIERVVCWSAEETSVRSFLDRTADLGLAVEGAEGPEAVVRQADILVTTTPAFEPVVKAEWLHPGLHINAVGADTRGKQELETGVLPLADLVVVDSFDQASQLGELQHPFQAGTLGRDQVVLLGQVLIGAAAGRGAADEVTVFDATGLIMQDLVIAAYVWHQVVAANV